MSGNKQSRRSNEIRRKNIGRITPISRAVRMAIATSVAIVALGAGNPASATDVTFGMERTPVADLTVVNDLLAGMDDSLAWLAAAIAESGPGDINIHNADPIDVAEAGRAIAIDAYSSGGNVSITNSAGADLTAASLLDYAIGIYGYSLEGDVLIDNAADIAAYSAGGIADGIFASGANVDVANSGDLYVAGATWAAGIEAQGTEATSVENSGDIYAYSLQQAYAIYATGADVTVANTGNLEAQGFYATGIEAQATGDLEVANSGDIVAGSITVYNGSVYGSGLATGIDAVNNGEGAAVAIDNSGDISAVAYYGATGISAISGGLDGTANVSNSGSIYVSQYTKYGYGAYGIVASTDGDAHVDNSGTIDVVSAGAANGVTAMSFAGDAIVSNSGDITATTDAFFYAAEGIAAFAGNGEAHVDNSGSVAAFSNYWASGITATAQGDVSVTNSGSLYASGLKYAYGMHAESENGAIAMHNEAAGEVGFYSYLNYGFGIVGWAHGDGDTVIENEGHVEGYAYGQSVGIFGISNAGDVGIDNSGSISVSTGKRIAVGINARAEYGTASIDNSGDIYATTHGVNGYEGFSATGIRATGKYTEVGNSGDITAIGQVFATGISVLSYNGTTITNDGGSIYASAVGGLMAGYYGYYLIGKAVGIEAESYNGDTTVVNASDITAIGTYVDAVGISAVSPFDIAVTNSGDIEVNSHYGYATGIEAFASYNYAYGTFDGAVTVNNTGNISVSAAYAGFGKAWGIYANRDTGDVSVNNGGDIDIYSGGRAYAVFASAKYGDVSVTNSGDITMFSPTDAQIGIQASTGSFFAGGGNVSVINSGNISVESEIGFANGIGAVAGSVMDPYGSSYIRNSGDIDATSRFVAAGIQTRATDGTATVINSGDINVATWGYYNYYNPGRADGIGVFSFFGGDLTIRNSGNVEVHGYANATGLSAEAYNLGNVSITNTGDVDVEAHVLVAKGIYAYSFNGDVTTNNSASGTIDATGGFASVGIQSIAVFGDNVVNNAGTIHAGGSLFAYGVAMFSYGGSSTLNNAATGVISADGAEGYAFAVMGSDTVETINNSGHITGAVALYGGDDVFNNRSGGVWSTGGTHGSDFGDGNDSLNNLAGGLVDIQTGAITFGAGNDSLANAGTVRTGSGGTISFGDGNDSLTNAAGGLIDVVGGTIAMEAGNDTITNHGTFRLTGGTVTMGAGSNAFTNVGILKALGSSAIDLGGGTLTNLGAIDFLDGATDDKLTLTGTLAGSGALNLDLNLLNSTVDQLVVTGNVAANAVQRVNVAAPGLPTTAHTSAVFARVSGTSTASNFVAGQIFGYSPANFLDLDLSVSSQINAANTSADLFSVNVDVVGLSDSGSLAASVASGAAGFLNSQVGTFRQRLGVNPYGDAGKVMSAFVRVYTDEGDVDPAHVAANFGQGGNFAYDQASWGREVGVNANLFGNLHAGVVLGTADSRQRLTGAGVGQNRMDGMTWGAYATWYVPQGFYVDLTGRWMAMDVESRSIAGLLQTRAHTASTSLEAGYEWAVGGFTLVPQVQYTRTEVEDVRTVSFDRASFASHGGTSERGRLGVEVNKTFTAGNLRWTPYGSINAVREFDGEMSYTVGNHFFGSTGTKGTSAMAELGLGLQGGGWGFTIGANWIDGGAFNSQVSGQANLRFAW